MYHKIWPKYPNFIFDLIIVERLQCTKFKENWGINSHFMKVMVIIYYIWGKVAEGATPKTTSSCEA